MMLFNNLRRIFSKPDKQKEDERKREIDKLGLEKNDIPAMILSAYAMLLPMAFLVLGTIAIVAYLFVN